LHALRGAVITAAMDESEDLTPLDPAFVKQLRVSGAVIALIQLAIATVIELALPLPAGLFLIPSLALAAWLVLIVPARRYRRWGFAFGGDRLRVVHGYLFHHDTVVPLGRIQHIDVHQGPLMRHWGLASLTVHTAGNHGASITLPGLKLGVAEAMREAIRAHIRQGQA
jgi:membrane protein YdbS with pleckstrin-like domain